MLNLQRMKSKLPIKSNILIWARRSRGLSIEDVARRLKKPSDLIVAWEDGGQTPTFSELEHLAYDIYKRPLAVFFLSDIPKETDLKSEFRTLPENEISTFSQKLIKYIREAKDKQYSLQELFPHGNPSKRLLLESKLSSNKNPEDAADLLRKFLNITLSLQRSFKKPEDTYKYFRNLIGENGIYVFQYPIDLTETRGFCVYDKEFPVIVVSSKDSAYGKVFTVFHEIGHLLFQVSGISLDKGLLYRNETSKTIEIFCNKFAADILVPKQILLEHALVKGRKSGIWDREELMAISADFNVSQEVILRRLLDLGLAMPQEYEEFRKRMKEEISKRVRPKKGPPYAVKVISQLGHNYTLVVLNNLRKNVINEFQASDYLGVKMNNISQIESALLSHYG